MELSFLFLFFWPAGQPVAVPVQNSPVSLREAGPGNRTMQDSLSPDSRRQIRPVAKRSKKKGNEGMAGSVSHHRPSFWPLNAESVLLPAADRFRFLHGTLNNVFNAGNIVDQPLCLTDKLHPFIEITINGRGFQAGHTGTEIGQ